MPLLFQERLHETMKVSSRKTVTPEEIERDREVARQHGLLLADDDDVPKEAIKWD